MKFFYVFCVFLFFASGLHAEEAPMTFRTAWNGGNYSGAIWIAAEGRITSTTPDDFKKFLEKEVIENYQIVLNSSGGDVEAALRLGALIRQSEFDVAIGRTVPLDVEHIAKWGVGWLPKGENIEEDDLNPDWEGIARDGKCLSSCLWAFLGGVERFANSDDIAVERGIVPDVFDRAMLEHMTTLEIEPSLMKALMKLGEGEVYFFNDDELGQYKIRWHPGEFMPWKIEAYESHGVVASSETRDGKTTAMLFCNAKNAKFQINITDYIDIERHFEIHKSEASPDDTAETYMMRSFTEIHDGTNSVEIFGIKFPQDSFQLVWSEGISILSIDIKDPKALSFRPEHLSLDPSTAGVYNSFFQGFTAQRLDVLGDGMEGLNSEGLQQAANIAFKNCL